MVVTPPCVSGILPDHGTGHPEETQGPHLVISGRDNSGLQGELPDKRVDVLMPDSEFRWCLPAYMPVVGEQTVILIP